MNNTPVPAVLQPAPKTSNPPCSNRGVTYSKTPTPPPHLSSYSVLKNAFFDWYQASVEVDGETAMHALCDFYNGIPRPCKPQPPYLYAVEIFPAASVGTGDCRSHCSVHYGGINDKTMIRGTSDNAAPLSDYVRKTWPFHSVSRADVALDFQEGPEFFSDMADWLIAYAKKKRLKLGFLGDWVTGTQGRTLEVGSRSSAVYVRLYEKGLEQVAKGNHGVRLDWVRFEAEIKPANKAGKMNLSTVSPRECFGASRLLRAFAALLGDKFESLQVGTVRTQTDFDKTFGHLCYQYGDLFERLSDRTGGDLEQFARAILDRVEKEKATRKASRDSVTQYTKRDLKYSDITRASRSVPRSYDYPVPFRGLNPSLMLRYPSLLRCQLYRLHQTDSPFV